MVRTVLGKQNSRSFQGVFKDIQLIFMRFILLRRMSKTSLPKQTFWIITQVTGTTYSTIYGAILLCNLNSFSEQRTLQLAFPQCLLVQGSYLWPPFSEHSTWQQQKLHSKNNNNNINVL